MNKKSIKKNYILNLIYEVFALLVPVLVMPYISRVLGAEGVGIYSYTYSIVYYFILLGSLGFTTYARRELSKKRDDSEGKYKLFWEVTIVKFITCLFSIIVYEIVINCFYRGTYYFVFLQTIVIYLIGSLLDIVYYFQAHEDFDKIVYKNIFIKIIGTIAIFLLVKDSNDLFLYILIQALIFVVSNSLLWIALPKEIFKVKCKNLQLKKHLRPAVKLFIPTVASSVYTILDKTLIGALVTETIEKDDSIMRVADIEIGVYEQVEKLIKMSITVLTSLSTIISPRNSYYFAKKQFERIKQMTFRSYAYVMMLSIPMVFGVFLVSDYFCPLFFGEGFEKAPELMNILSVLIFLISLSGVFGMQYLTAIGEDNKYIISVTAGAAINIILNILLIPNLYSYGAAIATISAEAVILLLLMIFSAKIIEIKKLVLNLLKYLLGALIMFCLANLIVLPKPTYTIAARLSSAVVSYGLYLIIIRDYHVRLAKGILAKKIRSIKNEH